LLAELGGFWSPSGHYRFRRTYANGMGTATGTGNTDGDQTYGFGRLGGVINATPKDEVALSVEVGRQTLTTLAYDEALTATNPFEAHAARARDTATVGKLRGQWTHELSAQIDTTLWGAWAHSFTNRSTSAAAIPGFGTLSPASRNQDWGEFGARIGIHAARRFTIDLFANGVGGIADIGTRVHAGVDAKLDF
jgi:hypothetical protein